MSLGIPLNLCFCLLICLVYGSLMDEKPGNETLVPHHEDDDHRHMMKLMSCFNDFVQNSNKCLPYWLLSNGSCYRYFEEHKNFAAAEDMCRSYRWNSHLVSIHNDDVGNFLARTVIPPEENGDVWIGLHNVNKNCRDWAWTDESPVDYKDQLDPGNCDSNDVCVHLSRSKNFQNWVAVECNIISAFICKYKLRC